MFFFIEFSLQILTYLYSFIQLCIYIFLDITQVLILINIDLSEVFIHIFFKFIEFFGEVYDCSFKFCLLGSSAGLVGLMGDILLWPFVLILFL